MPDKMTVGELKRRLNEFGTGADDCVVVLVMFGPTGKLSRSEMATDVPFIVNAPELMITFGPEEK